MDVTGTWTGKLDLSTGDEVIRSHAHVVLIQDGKLLSGTAGPNRDRQAPIKDGSIAADWITFDAGPSGQVLHFALRVTEDRLVGRASNDSGVTGAVELRKE